MLEIKPYSLIALKLKLAPTEENKIETQKHLTQCKKLTQPSEKLKETQKYEDLFNDDLEKQINIFKNLKEKIQLRKTFL